MCLRISSQLMIPLRYQSHDSRLEPPKWICVEPSRHRYFSTSSRQQGTGIRMELISIHRDRCPHALENSLRQLVSPDSCSEIIPYSGATLCSHCRRIEYLDRSDELARQPAVARQWRGVRH